MIVIPTVLTNQFEGHITNEFMCKILNMVRKRIG